MLLSVLMLGKTNEDNYSRIALLKNLKKDLTFITKVLDELHKIIFE